MEHPRLKRLLESLTYQDDLPVRWNITKDLGMDKRETQHVIADARILMGQAHLEGTNATLEQITKREDKGPIHRGRRIGHHHIPDPDGQTGQHPAQHTRMAGTPVHRHHGNRALTTGKLHKKLSQQRNRRTRTPPRKRPKPRAGSPPPTGTSMATNIMGSTGQRRTSSPPSCRNRTNTASG